VPGTHAGRRHRIQQQFHDHGLQVGLKYGQGLAIAADSLDTRPGSGDTARYLSDRAKDLDIAKTRGLDVVYKDSMRCCSRPIAAPTTGACGLSQHRRAGRVRAESGRGPAAVSRPDAFPGRLRRQPAPYGVTFSGPAFSEPKLIGSPTRSSGHAAPPAAREHAAAADDSSGSSGATRAVFPGARALSPRHAPPRSPPSRARA